LKLIKESTETTRPITHVKLHLILSEEERDFGLSDLTTWIKWFKMAGGVVFSFICVFALAIDRGFYVLNELW
jgi:hypothetical protein